MNILYIEHYAGSPEMGMEYRPYYLASEWVKMGHEVTILAGDYSHLRKNNPDVARDMEKTTTDGIDYYWLKTGEYEGNGVKRALTMLRFCRKILKYKKQLKENIKPDVVISSSTYPIDSIPASKFKAVHIHEVHDMWPSTLIEVGGMSRLNPFVVLMQFGENYAYKHADAVVSLLGHAKDYMVSHGLKPEKFHNIPNGIVTDEWESPMPLPDPHKTVLDRLRNEGKFIVGYFGGHALSNCLMTLIESAESINEERVHFVLVGDGVEKANLVKYTDEHGLKNITFLPPVNKKAVPSLTEYFDCTYIGVKDSPLYRFGVCMNKMFDGMMAGKPVIFAINAPKTPVEEADCGIIVRPEDPEMINDAIRRLMDMSDSDRALMGARGREEMLRKYTYRKLAEEFIKVMSEA